jgi:hypothetical protein
MSRINQRSSTIRPSEQRRGSIAATMFYLSLGHSHRTRIGSNCVRPLFKFDAENFANDLFCMSRNLLYERCGAPLPHSLREYGAKFFCQRDLDL